MKAERELGLTEPGLRIVPGERAHTLQAARDRGPVREDRGGRRVHVRADGIAAVAAALGYASEFSFAAAFKRHHGVAPGRWRVTARPGGTLATA